MFLVKDLPISNVQAGPPAYGERTILFFSAVSTLAVLGWMLWYCRYGIDLTDEGFYLIWIANPFNYSVSVTQFGFVYHPLYEWLNGNIADLRRANVLITFCLSWALAYAFLTKVFGVAALKMVPRLITAAALATAGLTSYVLTGTWLASPSYNSLAFQSMLFASIGLLLAEKQVDRASVAGWFLIGLGGWLAFMAKPTTALALGTCIFLYLLLAGKFHVRLLALSIVTAIGMTIFTALGIDGSITSFTNRLKGGLELTSKLGGYGFWQLFRLDAFEFKHEAQQAFLASTATLVGVTVLSYKKMRASRYASVTLSIALALAAIAIATGYSRSQLFPGQFQALLLWSVPVAAALTALFVGRMRNLRELERSQWALCLTFLTLPYAFAFGTSNIYGIFIVAAGFFAVLGGLVLLVPLAQARAFPGSLLTLALAVQIIAVALVHAGFETPYRQPQPLRQDDYKIEIGRPGSDLVIPASFGRYYKDFMGAATLAGFKKGTPMIDLSGLAPGVLYAIGANSVGTAWMVGGYPGSDNLAKASLANVPCDQLATAWVLYDPQSPGKISPEVLSSFGADLAQDFRPAGIFTTVEGASGQPTIRTQQFFRPVRAIEAASKACSASR
jgi:hypothetical protein